MGWARQFGWARRKSGCIRRTKGNSTISGLGSTKYRRVRSNANLAPSNLSGLRPHIWSHCSPPRWPHQKNEHIRPLSKLVVVAWACGRLSVFLKPALWPISGRVTYERGAVGAATTIGTKETLRRNGPLHHVLTIIPNRSLPSGPFPDCGFDQIRGGISEHRVLHPSRFDPIREALIRDARGLQTNWGGFGRLCRGGFDQE